jgi:hypothetical protein
VEKFFAQHVAPEPCSGKRTTEMLPCAHAPIVSMNISLSFQNYNPVEVRGGVVGVS